MLFYYIYKMSWANDFLNQFFLNLMYRTMYHILYLLKQSTMGKPRLKKIPMRLRPEGGGGVNVIFSVFTYVTELLKTNK